MILLDTDHLTALKYDEHPRCRALRERMNASDDPFFATTIISAEEQMRGWLAKIHAAKDAGRSSCLLARYGRFVTGAHLVSPGRTGPASGASRSTVRRRVRFAGDRNLGGRARPAVDGEVQA